MFTNKDFFIPNLDRFIPSFDKLKGKLKVFQEFSDSFASSNSLNCRTVLKNMPALDNNFKYFRKSCLEDIGVGVIIQQGRRGRRQAAPCLVLAPYDPREAGP